MRQWRLGAWVAAACWLGTVTSARAQSLAGWPVDEPAAPAPAAPSGETPPPSSAAPPAAPAVPAQPPPPPPATAAPRITDHASDDESVPLSAERIKTFSEIVDAPRSVVILRLKQDPAMAAEATAAVEAREHRKASGKSLLAVGIAIIVVAEIAGLVISYSSLVDGTATSGDTDTALTRSIIGAGVALVGFGAGAAFAVPGIVSMAAKSDDEKRAIRDFQGASSSAPRPPFPAGVGLTAPLLRLSF
jgi:hypothetical protein